MTHKPAIRAGVPSYDQGGPALSVGFEYPAEEPASDELARIRQETMMRLIQFLAVGSKAQIGQRVELIAFVLRVSECRTQAQLAKKLKVTPARVSQALNILKSQIALFAEG